MGENDFEVILHKKSSVTTANKKVKEIMLKNKVLLLLNNTTKRCIDISTGIVGTFMLIPITVLVILINAI